MVKEGVSRTVLDRVEVMPEAESDEDPDGVLDDVTELDNETVPDADSEADSLTDADVDAECV